MKTMTRASLIMLVVLGALIRRAFPQSATQGWMYGISDAFSPQIRMYNPTIDPPVGPISFNPWPAGAFNADDYIDAIAMDSTNNQLVIPKCKMPCATCATGCISCDMWSYDAVTGAMNKFLENWPPCAQWVTSEPPPAVLAGAFMNGGYVTIQPWQNAGAQQDEAYLWWLPLTFNSATKTYTSGAPKRYILKVTTCPDFKENNPNDLAFNSATKKAYWTGSAGNDCTFVEWDATSVGTGANGTTLTGQKFNPDPFFSYYLGMSCDNVLYGNDCSLFYTINQVDGVETSVPNTNTMPVCIDMAGSVCNACPLHAPADVCTPGPPTTPPPSPGPGPVPTGCTSNKVAFASTSPSGKVAPSRVFTYSATLVNSNKASVRSLQGVAAQGAGSASASGLKSPFFSANFSMQLPPGVTYKSGASSPKTTISPTVNANDLLTWNLGANLAPGRKLKMTLKLMTEKCTTPASLPLIGRFSYEDMRGPKTVSACLKKELYVWANGCAPIPQGKTGSGSVNAPNAKETWSRCVCDSTCKCTAKDCTCPKDECFCTAI